LFFMQLLPLFLNLSGRRVVLVGDDRASGKRDMLVGAGADVRVVRPDAFDDEALDGAWLVVSFAPADVNARVARAAESRRIFVNAVDDPPNASAYLGGVIRRDGVTIAISTDGQAPALAGLLREGLDALLPGDLDQWMETARTTRARWKADGTPIESRRPQLLEALVDLYAEARP
jgi:uroporphyrin-III C-methyltransferase/precorrin-2 dehydrogenase/sirohydrochlorin ferrochelatase